MLDSARGSNCLQQALRLDTESVLVFRQYPATPPPIGESSLYFSDEQWTRVTSLAPNGDLRIDQIPVEEATIWFRQHGQPLPRCLEPAYLFSRQGDRWLIQDGRRRGYVKHSKGMFYVANLLRCPWQLIPSAQLVRYITDAIADTRTTQAASEQRDESIQFSRPQDASDAEALANYRRRMQYLIEAIAEAEAANCKDEADKCRREFYEIAKIVKPDKARRDDNRSRSKVKTTSEQSLEEIAERTFSGKRRALPESDGSNKARTAVTNAIKRALKTISECPQLEETAAFLEKNIDRGANCSYFPDPQVHRWIVEM